MRIPKLILIMGLVVLCMLLLSPRRHPLAYNAATEVTVHGVVQDVRTFWCPVSGEEGTHLTITSSAGEVQVHVAPARFLNGRQWTFSRGDVVDVVGARIHYLGHDALIARSITKGTETVALRTSSGQPLWTN